MAVAGTLSEGLAAFPASLPGGPWASPWGHWPSGQHVRVSLGIYVEEGWQEALQLPFVGHKQAQECLGSLPAHCHRTPTPPWAGTGPVRGLGESVGQVRLQAPPALDSWAAGLGLTTSVQIGCPPGECHSVRKQIFRYSRLALSAPASPSCHLPKLAGPREASRAAHLETP